MTHDEAYPRLPDLLWIRLADAGDADLRRHVEECEECRARLSELRAVHSALAGLDGSEAPPTLAARVGDIPARYAQEPADRPSTPRTGRRALAAVAGAAAAVVAAALVALALIGGGEPAEAGPFHAVEGIEVADPRSAVAGRIELGGVEGGNRMIRLAVHGLDTEGAGYELWLTGERGEVSAGTFRPDKNGACVVMLSAPDDEWTSATIVRAGSAAPPVVTVDL